MKENQTIKIRKLNLFINSIILGNLINWIILPRHHIIILNNIAKIIPIFLLIFNILLINELYYKNNFKKKTIFIKKNSFINFIIFIKNFSINIKKIFNKINKLNFKNIEKRFNENFIFINIKQLKLLSTANLKFTNNQFKTNLILVSILIFIFIYLNSLKKV